MEHSSVIDFSTTGKKTGTAWHISLFVTEEVCLSQRRYLIHICLARKEKTHISVAKTGRSVLVRGGSLCSPVAEYEMNVECYTISFLNDLSYILTGKKGS